uniref:NADH dehydrogenase subunit 4 n=1 Tax=Ichthyoxenos japonensis TaxID=2033261 RepID=UPI000EF35592|nr:NADH dehydrogenase subunit 4 [Ichthyoxenos japonensis]ATO58529.1 NADH dehydrogenase subunit 4 [Ichthyoxenos japonensis]
MSLLFMSSVLVFENVMSILGLSLVGLYMFMVFKHDLDWFMNYGVLMSDNLSMLMIMLSVVVTMFMNLSMMFDIEVGYKFLLKLVNYVLMMFLMFTFSMINFIGFYVFFEACLVPTFILIIGWGYQPERVNAGIYMLLYTVIASLPLLCGLLFLNKSGVIFMSIGDSLILEGLFSKVMFMFCLIAFLVKLPVYVLHLWLPKAHVEAPVSGSMILAGLLLKLGGYGLVRLMQVVGCLGSYVSIFILSWSMFGGVVIKIMCLRQVDIKCLIALSSVVHMAMVVGGVMIQNKWGYSSVVLIMVGHGLCSSGLFCMANMIYKNTGSRSMSMIKGVQLMVPSMGLLWFMLCSSNMSAPPSLSLLGEMSGGIGVVSWSSMFMMILFLLVFMSGAYSLYLFMAVMHGKNSNIVMSCKMKVGDMVLIMMHWMPLNLMFLLNLC